MDKTVLTLGVDSSQVGTAAVAFERLTASGNKAAASGGKVTAAVKEQGKAIGADLVPATKQAASALNDAANSTQKIGTGAVAAVAAELAKVESQANRTASAVEKLSRATGAPVSSRFGESPAPASRTPFFAPNPISATTRQAAPVASVALLAGEAGRAQRAVDKLTNSARTQRSALAQLAPAAANTAASYREIAASPITFAAPQGLQNAAASLAAVITSLSAARAPVNAGGTRQTAAAAAAARELADGNRAVGASARLAAQQQQQLAYQLNDFFVQVASGQSALIALIQQGSQLSGTYGGLGNTFRALAGLVTPARLAIAGAAGAVATLAIAFYEGYKQSKAFNDALVLTGNYAGQTEGKVNSLARRVAADGLTTVAAVREAAQALAATGEIGPQVFSAAVEAAALYAQATGQTSDEVAKDFASMARAPTKFAAEANRSLNFLSAAQYEAIKAFEENGRAADAQGVIYDALNTRLKALDPNLGTIERGLRGTKNAWKSFWDAALDIGRTETVEDKLKRTEEAIAFTQKQMSNPKGTFVGTVPFQGGKPKTAADVVAEQQAQRLALSKKLFREGENAAAEAFRSEANKAAIAADSVVDGYLKRGKAASGYKQKLDELERSFRAKENADVPVSDADKKVARAQLKKDFAGPKSSGNEASQILRAQLDRDIKGMQDALDLERDAFAFHNRFLQGEYQAGKLSLESFYADRRDTTARAVDAEIAELEQERARLEQFKAAVKDPSEKLTTQTRIDENVALQGKVRANADRDIELSNQEETASFKQLSDQVTNYRANLLQMQGDELGAARVRAQSAIANAKILSAQAGGGVDVVAMARAIKVTDEFNEVQRRAQVLVNNTARAEEAFGLAAELTGKSLIETERGVFAIRSKELEQLGALAAKAKELAAASTDPRIKAFAADLALEYAKAAAAIDPALNRLREATKDLASGIAGTLGDAPSAFVQEFAQRRTAAKDDIKDQRDFYSRKIDLLEGYLATTQDKNDKARLRERIKQAESQRDGARGESKGSSFLGALGTAIIKPIGEQIFTTVNKLLITDPLQAYLQAQLKGLTEGGGVLANLFGDALGIKEDPKDAALALQTAAITSSTSALDLLAQAAQAAAAAVNTRAPGLPAVDGELPGFLGEVDADRGAEIGGDSLLDLGKSAVTTTSDLAKLASAAGVGGTAMARLPGIIGLFQSAIAALSASSAAGSAGGGFLNGLMGILGMSSGGAGQAGYEAMASYGLFHTGGIVGQASATRTAPTSAFVGAPRYHTGGLAGQKADKLRQNEVAAILMGGPKGKREEVLTADDPRHRDNLGAGIIARIMAESKHEGMKVKGARALGGPVSANSMYRVNEKRPELLQVAGKQYLMTGSQGGTVKENAGAEAGQTIQMTVQVAAPAGASAASAQQWGTTAGRHIQKSLRRNS